MPKSGFWRKASLGGLWLARTSWVEVVFCALMALVLTGSKSVRADDLSKVEFNRDIRPILSENCYACHGPDARKREAGLRLDVESSAKSMLESGVRPVVPGKSSESELVARITSTEPTEVMPPPETTKKLTPAQIAVLKRWIDQGAPWEGHWAFLPIKRKPTPTTQDPAFVKNPIDAFILAKQKEQNLVHASEADRAVLARRLSFDLLGLPPKPEDVEQFVADRDEKAYEKLVDRFLASPRYGERMAMFWLDLVRYADSVGYHGDQPMSVSPFRDYVIASFNANKPFDQMTVEHLAGDLLPNPTREQKIASGYNRLGMMSAEGGVQDKEYLAKYIAERVRNASGTWLGVTMGCCECHDHKFDPFLTKEFYRFEAFFADIEERGLYPYSDTNPNWGPSIPVPSPEQEQHLAKLNAEIANVRQQVDNPSPELVKALNQGLAAWEQSVAPKLTWEPLLPFSAVSQQGATLRVLPDGSILAEGARPATDTYIIQTKVKSKDLGAIRLEVLPDDSLPKKGPGRADNGNFVLTEVVVETRQGDNKPNSVGLRNATATIEQKNSANNNPYKAWTIASAIDGDVKGKEWGWAILDEAGLANSATFECKDLVKNASDVVFIVTLKQLHTNPNHTLGRFRLSAASPNSGVKAFGAGLPRNIRDLLAIEPAKRSEAQNQELVKHYRTMAPELKPLRDQLAVLENELKTVSSKVPTTLITKAVPPRTIRVLARGNWMDESGEIVEPGTPSILPAVKWDGPQRRLNRLDLAKWMVAKDHPLTARVLANRLWKLMFGAGLSRKMDDFGAQGEWPSHPELLDWLASELIDSGWNIKATLKTIVMSGTYRQSSTDVHKAREKDPFNRWLACQTRYRLDAELVRDNALSISGLLIDQIGGLSVKPYQPPGYWAHLNFPTREWQNGSGDQLYRRGLYTHWQRQYLHPSMLAFDAPTREECVADRVRSNTPLQSLVLLNDPIYVEIARTFAEQAILQGGSNASDRLNWMFRRALSRPAKPAELDLITKLIQRHETQYRQDANAARDLLAIGEKKPNPAINPAELAAWTSAARLILNLHETITRN